MTFPSQRYAFIGEALTGTGGFAPSITFNADGKAVSVGRSHLVQYPRESDEKFARRNELAWYENHLLPACMRFVGYLSKKPPIRELPHALLEEFASDCNWKGDAIDVFWQGFMLNARSRGCMLLLVDMPRMQSISAADQIEARFFPYLVPIAPERVTKYQLNERGAFSFIEYGDTTPEGKAIIRGWDEEKWWVREGGSTIDGDAHNLGKCPVLYFSENGDFPCVGPYAQIADLSRRLFNARSELDEILRGQTFSLLTYQVPVEQVNFNPGDVASGISVNNIITHQGIAPSFVAPPEGPAKTYLDAIAHIEAAIARIGLAMELPDNQSAESGLALSIRFQSLNSALTSFARRMEDLERNAWALVSLWLGLSAEGAVEWAKDYALADLAAEMQTLASMISAGMPDAVVRQQKKMVTQLAFPALPADEMSALIDAIDESEAVSSDPAIAATTANSDAVTSAATEPQQQIDLAPITDRLASIEASIAAMPTQQPVINVTPAITIEPQHINVTMPEQQPVSTPNVTLNTGTGGKVVSLVRDHTGAISGATVKEHN